VADTCPTLFVMDPLDRINVQGDSTYMLMLEAQRRGFPVWMCTPPDLYTVGGLAHAKATKVTVSTTAPHFVCEPAVDIGLDHFDVVWMRKDPPFNMDYVFSTYILDAVPRHTLVLNDPRSIRNASEKMFTLQFSQFITPTLITREVKRVLAFAAEAPDKVVLKPWDGNGGRGVLVSRHGDANLRSMAEILTAEGTAYVIAQHYIPDIKKGDKRIILVDGEPVGQMLRVPQPGDHRGNMHVGATVEACDLSPRDQEVCAVLGPRLREMGLLFVGIDMIGDFLTEINVTSPTGIQEINALMGVQLERVVTDAVVARHARHIQETSS
jgi:glutathione synthase